MLLSILSSGGPCCCSVCFSGLSASQSSMVKRPSGIAAAGGFSCAVVSLGSRPLML